MTNALRVSPSLLLGLFLCFFTFLPLWQPLGIEFSIYNAKRITEIALLGGSAILLIASTSSRIQFIKSFQQLPEMGRLGIVAFFGLGVISTLQAELPRYGFLEIGIYSLLFIFALSLAAEISGNHKIAERVIWLIFSAVGIYSTFFYINLFWPFANNNLAPGFSNLRFLAQFQAWTLPLITLPVFLQPNGNRLLKWLVLAVASLWWGIAFFNSAKGLALSILLSSLLILLFMKDETSRAWFILQVKVALVGLAIYLVLTMAISQSGYLTNIQGSYSNRLALWKESLNYITQHPVLGIGPLHLANHYNGLGAHPHNSILQIAAEWGVPAALIVVLLYIWGFWSWITHSIQQQRHLNVALSFSLLTATIYSMFSGIIVMPVSQVMMTLVIALMLGSYQRPTTQQAATSRSSSQWLLVLAMVLLLTRFASVLFPEVLHLSRDEFIWIVTHSKNGNTVLHPRFWQQGWIQRI